MPIQLQTYLTFYVVVKIAPPLAPTRPWYFWSRMAVVCSGISPEVPVRWHCLQAVGCQDEAWSNVAWNPCRSRSSEVNDIETTSIFMFFFSFDVAILVLSVCWCVSWIRSNILHYYSCFFFLFFVCVWTYFLCCGYCFQVAQIMIFWFLCLHFWPSIECNALHTYHAKCGIHVW